MSVKIYFEDFKPNGNTINTIIPKEFGTGKMNQFSLNDGILFHRFDMTPKVDLLIENEFESEPIISMAYFVEGGIYYKNYEFKFEKYLKKDTLNVSFLNYENGSSIYKKDVPIKASHIVLQKGFIERYLLDFIDNETIDMLIKKDTKKTFFKNIANSVFDINTSTVLKELHHTPYTGNLEKLFITTKVYELIFNSFDLISKNTQEYISDQDMYYLNTTKDFIIKNLDKDLSLKQLAKISRSNENKLQKNFKSYFGQTVFDFILDHKMQKAKKLLLSSDYNINEISKEVGYKHQSNFSIAFTKRYGINPKEVLKSRKYYHF
jgi:AraC-like DNA-binding protein